VASNQINIPSHVAFSVAQGLTCQKGRKKGKTACDVLLQCDSSQTGVLSEEYHYFFSPDRDMAGLHLATNQACKIHAYPPTADR